MFAAGRQPKAAYKPRISQFRRFGLRRDGALRDSACGLRYRSRPKKGLR